MANAEEAKAIWAEYERAMETIEAEGLDANVSVKLTGLGLNVDPELCAESVRAGADAAGHGRFVRIDMEDSSTTTATLDLYRRLRAEGHDNVGIVLQAMLRRTLDDVAELAELRPNVRVCKGIYVEPAEIAYQGDEAVRFNFVETISALWEGGAKVAVATHDDALVGKALELIREHGLGHERYEFQLLLGVREELADELVARRPHGADLRSVRAEVVRVLAPAPAQENPKLAGYVARDAVHRLRP